jgi:uncharacterized protein (DUF1778 family)
MSPKTKDSRLMLRLNAADLEQWRLAANAADLTLSDWIRQQCNAAAAKALRAKR